MQRQVDMEKSMLTAHRDFMDNLEKSLKILHDEIEEAKQMETVPTHEWRLAVEQMIDELHKSVFSISEPRFLTKEDSDRIRDLRTRLKDLYLHYSKTIERTSS